MKWTLVSLLLLFWSCLVRAEASYHQPILSAAEVVRKTELFLSKRGTDLSKTKLQGASFDFLWGNWWISYLGTELEFGNDLMVRVSNEAEPTFDVTGGI